MKLSPEERETIERILKQHLDEAGVPEDVPVKEKQ